MVSARYKSEKSQLHEGHRDRMYQRFLRDLSLENFEQHEILEMLLYRPKIMGNTSETAHLLINRFGSLLGVLQAPPAELRLVKGVTERMAHDLSLIFHAYKTLPSGKIDRPNLIRTTQEVFAFTQNRLKYERTELLYIMCLDVADRLINCSANTDYLPAEANMDTRTIASVALRNGASKIVLVHNHPSGQTRPSEADDRLTSETVTALAAIGISLLDHVVIAGEDYYSYAQNGRIQEMLARASGAQKHAVVKHAGDFARRTIVDLNKIDS